MRAGEGAPGLHDLLHETSLHFSISLAWQALVLFTKGLAQVSQATSVAIALSHAQASEMTENC